MPQIWVSPIVLHINLRPGGDNSDLTPRNKVGLSTLCAHVFGFKQLKCWGIELNWVWGCTLSHSKLSLFIRKLSEELRTQSFQLHAGALNISKPYLKHKLSKFITGTARGLINTCCLERARGQVYSGQTGRWTVISFSAKTKMSP